MFGDKLGNEPPVGAAPGPTWSPTSGVRGGIARGAVGLLLALTVLLAFAPPAGAQSVPGAVTGLGAFGAGTYITLRWNRPESDGGSRITGYQYRHRTHGSDGTAGDWSGWTTTASRVRNTVSGFDDTKTYEFEVQALNAHGAGPGAFITVHAKLPAPTGLGVVRASPATSALTFSWDAVTGSPDPLKQYRWERRRKGSSDPSELRIDWVGPGTTQATATRLAPRTTYEFRVRAETEVREGAWSTWSEGVTGTSASVRAVTPAFLVAANIQANGNQATLRITLSSGGSWDAGAAASHFSVSGLPGVTVQSVSNRSGGSIDVTIGYDGSDLDSNATLVFSVEPAAHDDSNAIVASTPVTAVLPTVSVLNIRVAEGRADGPYPQPPFWVRSSPSPNQGISVRWAMRSEPGDTADGNDYGPVSAPNPRILTGAAHGFHVAIREDTIDEDNETFTLTLSHLSANARFAGGGTTLTAKATIEDDDTKASAPTGLSAVASPTLSGTVDLKWSAPADPGVLNGAAATVAGYQIRTATTREDLDAAPWFDTGDTRVTATFSGRAIGDHYFQVRAITGVTDANGAPAGAVSGIASATLQPPAPAVPDALRATQRTESAIQIAWSASTYSGSEGVVYTSERRTSGSGDSWEEAETGADTHRRFGGLSAGTDYDFRVRACAAGTDECSGYAQGTFATLAAPAAAVATLALAPLTIDESGPNNVATLRATLDTALATVTTLNVSAAPPGVVTLGSTTLTIPAGETESTGSGISITAVDDEVASGADARVTLSATAPAGVGAPALVTLTVVDDDGTTEPPPPPPPPPPPDTATVSVTDASASEGEAVTFTVTVSGAALGQALALVATPSSASDDTASAGTDYATAAQPVRLVPGQRSATFSVATVEDDEVEPDETFTVTLSPMPGTSLPAGVTIGDATATGTIVSDDLAAYGLPLVLSASSPLGRQSFARIINRSEAAGEVRIEAYDDEGVAAGPVTLSIGAGEAAHFNSEDLEEGNAAKGLSGGIGTGSGHWRLALTSDLDLEVLGYLRTGDGFVTSMHDLVTESEGTHRVVFFNPASNRNQVSRLRLINRGEQSAEVSIEGIDDDGESPGTAVELSVPAHGARTVTAQALESEAARGEALRDLNGALGDGAGKWRLRVTSDRPIAVMSLLSTPTGHLTNLSTAPGNAGSGDDGATTVHRLALVLGADDPQMRQGFVRIINRSDEAGEVRIEAFDDAGVAAPPVTLDIGAGEAVNFNSDDLEEGDADKGLSGGVGDGAGDWRLALASALDLQVLSYIRTDDGFVTSMHDRVPHADGTHRVVFFNPGSNASQVSRLRLVNPGEAAVEVSVEGIDDEGRSPGGTVRVEVPAGAAQTLTARALESGEGLSGMLGDGDGKWRLTVSADEPIEVMSLLASPTGHLTNLSTAPPPGRTAPSPAP